ncbi:MAG: DUF4147 domain-containing protein [Candidatus Thermoplasmatota archaeon]
MHDAALDAYAAGLAAVDPTVLVRKAVRQGWLDDWLIPPGTKREEPKRIRVLALGKAAPRMLWGLVEAGVPFAGLGVAPKGVHAPNVDTFTWLPGDHPLPGPGSFTAGAAVLNWIDALAPDEPVLVLLSGGASACAEVPHGISPEALRTKWETLLRSGLPIDAMNRERSALSALKGGKLGQRLLARTRRARVWLLADTERALAPQIVGSGPFHVPGEPDAIPHRVLAGTEEMIAAAGLRLATLGYEVHRHGRRVAGDAESEVAAFLAAAKGLPGRPAALVGGGECSVSLPVGTPPGGRCQHAAVFAAKWLAEDADASSAFLCVASDGVDGSTDAAGALVSAGDWTPEAAAALEGHAAHALLDRRGRLIHMGATGTNVNDLWIALRP